MTSYYNSVIRATLTPTQATSSPTALYPGIASHHSSELPLVTVVMPIFNEESYIEACLTNIFAQDYPMDKLEIIIADGMSTDRTRAIIQKIIDGDCSPGSQKKYGQLNAKPQITLLDNPKRIVSTGLNLAILQAKGEIIIRIDGHTLIESDYVAQCVLALQRTQVAGVGGPMISRGRGYMAEGIAIATSTPFGIGNSTYRTSRYFKEQPVETTHMGAYWKKALLDVGLFDEKLVRHQDYELDYRIRHRGGTVLLSPHIRSHYYVRGSLQKLWRQYLQYGFWKGRFLRRNPLSLKWRHTVPPLLVLSLLVGGLGAMINPIGKIIFSAEVVLYLIFILIGVLVSCGKEKLKYFPILPLIFFCLHFSWGSGVWLGLLMPNILAPQHWER